MKIDFPTQISEICDIARSLNANGDYIAAVSLLRNHKSPQSAFLIGEILYDNDLYDAAINELHELKRIGYDVENVDLALLRCRLLQVGFNRETIDEITAPENLDMYRDNELRFDDETNVESLLLEEDESLCEDDFHIVKKPSNGELTDEEFAETLDRSLSVESCKKARRRMYDIVKRNPTDIGYLTLAVCVFHFVTDCKNPTKKDLAILDEVLKMVDAVEKEEYEFYDVFRLSVILSQTYNKERAYRWTQKMLNDDTFPAYSTAYLAVFQLLYNLDKKDEARSLIYKMNVVYPCALHNYYLTNFDKLGNELGYVPNLPVDEEQKYIRKLKAVNDWDDAVNDPEFAKYIDWALRDNVKLGSISHDVIAGMLRANSARCDERLKQVLVRRSFDVEKKEDIIINLLLHGNEALDISLKSGIYYTLRVKLPKILAQSTANAIGIFAAEHVLTEEDVSKMVTRAVELGSYFKEEEMPFSVRLYSACVIACEYDKNACEIFDVEYDKIVKFLSSLPEKD